MYKDPCFPHIHWLIYSFGSSVLALSVVPQSMACLCDVGRSWTSLKLELHGDFLAVVLWLVFGDVFHAGSRYVLLEIWFPMLQL